MFCQIHGKFFGFCNLQVNFATVHICTCKLEISIFYFAADKEKNAVPYEQVRLKVMEENAARMAALLQSASPNVNAPLDDFRDLARSFVFGCSQKGTKTKDKEAKGKQKEETFDPEYQPDDAEKAAAEQDLDADEEERRTNTLHKVIFILIFNCIYNTMLDTHLNVHMFFRVQYMLMKYSQPKNIVEL
jgi:hypothetical protein